ncbi:MAG: hypothetical protein K2I10_01885 [Lachnospiraceae bacterium]|nr:hypothetical protein [Lachnospiraceae bacterium]
MEYANQSKDAIRLKNGEGLLDNIGKKEILYDIKDNDKSIFVSNNNLLCNYMSQSKIEDEERIEKILEKYDDFLKKYFNNRAFEVGDFYDTGMPEILIGIILEKDGSYYYGNLDNKTSEELVKENSTGGRRIKYVVIEIV